MPTPEDQVRLIAHQPDLDAACAVIGGQARVADRHRVCPHRHLPAEALPRPGRDSRPGVLRGHARRSRRRRRCGASWPPRPRLKILHAAKQDLEVMLLHFRRAAGPDLRHADRCGPARPPAPGRLRCAGGGRTRRAPRQDPDAHRLVAPATVRGPDRIRRQRRRPSAGAGRAAATAPRGLRAARNGPARTVPRCWIPRSTACIRRAPGSDCPASSTSRSPCRPGRRRLAAWREQRADRADRPRQWILTDQALQTLAARNPRRHRRHRGTGRDARRARIRNSGEAILAELRQADADLASWRDDPHAAGAARRRSTMGS